MKPLVGVICVAALFGANGITASANADDDKWDRLLRGIEIQIPPGGSDYQLDNEAPPDNPSSQSENAQNDADLNRENEFGSQADKAAHYDDQHRSNHISNMIEDDQSGSSPEPIAIPDKPQGLQVLPLPSGSFRDGVEVKRLLFKLDVSNSDHARYMMSYLANEGLDGWTWEQKNRSQKASSHGPALTEVEIIMSKYNSSH